MFYAGRDEAERLRTVVASLIEEALPRLARSSKAVTARSDSDTDPT